MKKKYVKRIAIIMAAVLALGTGGTVGVRRYIASRAQSVEVFPVSSVNAADWIGYFTERTTSGTVVSDVSQNVYVPDDKVISEVYVNQGDEVKIGDKLLSYDTTLLELDLELQQLEIEQMEQEIESAKADLQKLKNTTPVERSEDDEDEIDFLGPNQELPGSDDEEDDEARLVPAMRVMTASQDEPQQIADEPETVPPTEAPQPETAQQTEAPQPETMQQTEAPQPETPPTEAPQPETMQPTEAPQPETAQQTEAPQPETAQQTEAPQSETVQPTEVPQPEMVPPTEALQPGSEQIDTNYLDIDDIPVAEQQGAEQLPVQSSQEAEKEKQPKMNQSLLKFLSYVRVKEVEETEETLVADTRDEQEEPVSMSLPENELKLIPHFKEQEKAHFERLNTYTMLIRGITLKEEKVGKLYGIAKINGEDYPEIGGYTLIQDPEDETVVHLTLAFHEGLEEQHEIAAELEDMYAEISLEAEELTGDKLIFRTAKQENDIEILVERPDGEKTTAGNVDAQADGNIQPVQEESAAPFEDTEPAEATETTESAEATESADIEAVTESETVLNPDNYELTQTPKVAVDVTWYHGTNPEENWPASIQVDFYEKDNDQSPVQSITVSGAVQPETDEQTEALSGDEEPATEQWTEPVTQPATEAATEAATEDDMDMDFDFDAAPETEAQTAVVPQVDPMAGELEEVISPQDHTLSTVHWQTVQDWPGTLASPDTYTVNIPGIRDYIQTKEWVRDEAAGIYTCKVTMKYLEPEESPLVKLHPLTELTYETGAGGKYYKGSGTQDDPYVFFCVDGAVIRSSFVNWVLGFNADGTKRQKIVKADGTTGRMPLATGYYVVLELRESDTITGAFIKSVGLDGNIMRDYGYAPNVYWVFSSESGMVLYEEEIPDPEEPFDPSYWGDDPGWSDIGETYTAEELAQAIKDKEMEIRRLEADIKEAGLKLKQYQREMDESTVVSSVNGIVESLGDNTGTSSKAYMVVASQGGLYLRTTVSELDLDTVKKGDLLTATSWETQNQFDASITEINYFPTEGNDYYYGSGNPNASNYPVLAHIEDASGLTPYESVDVQFKSNQSTMGSIYLPVPYVRAENGQSYVYKVDENGLLKKQYVRTGSTINDNIEIKEGLSVDDSIAFPYGKSVKDGAKTKTSDGEDIYF